MSYNWIVRAQFEKNKNKEVYRIVFLAVNKITTDYQWTLEIMKRDLQCVIWRWDMILIHLKLLTGR